MSLFRFNKTYFILAVILFLTEVGIALYLNDRIIRPYVGDVLVVILMYCFVRAFLRTRIVTTAIAVLLFAYFVEACQYYKVIYKIGLDHSKLARVVMGIGFDWTDIIAYTLGFVLIMVIEYGFRKQEAINK